MANLSYGDIAKHTSYTRMSKLLIGKSIRDAIKVAPMSDADLGQKIGVSENTIRRWKLGTVTNIRKSNLSNLAKALNKQISFSEETVELEDFTETDNIITIENNGDSMQLKTDDIIADLQQDKRDLRETIASLKSEIVAIRSQKNEMEETVKILSRRPKMDLNHNRMQFVVDMVEQSYTNCSQLYADLFNKDAFDIIKEGKWSDFVHEDDMWRLEIIMSYETEEQRMEARTWRVCGSKGNAFIKTVSLPLDDEGRYKKVDAEFSTKEAWELDNEYFKTLKIKFEAIARS